MSTRCAPAARMSWSRIWRMSKRCWKGWVWPPARADKPGRLRTSAFDQANISRARSLAGILGCKFHALPFAKKFENGASHRAAMEEVLDAALVADEAESLVDEKSCDCPGWHTRSPPFRPLEDISRG